MEWTGALGWLGTPVILLAAVLAGMLASAIRLPPLVGFLAAGFILNGVGIAPPEGLTLVADLGVTLLLFTIGLRFDVRALLRREVWGTASIHIGVSTLVGTGLLGLLATVGFGAAGADWRSWALWGFALSFSSTVLAVKVLEERGDDRTLYGQTAIGILLVQDVAAVLFMVFAAGEVPSPWAFELVLLVPGAWLLYRLLDRIGHDELLVLLGLVLALVPGWALFSSVGLEGNLGALILGLLVAPHARADEIARTLFGLKELLLTGFFVSIGFGATLTPSAAGMAAVLCALMLAPKTILYSFLIYRARLRRRTSVLAGLALSNFSEFALIVGGLGVANGMLPRESLAVIAVALGLSMALSSIANRQQGLAERLTLRLPQRPAEQLDPRDRPIDIGGAEAIILGMGRIGQAAYARLAESFRASAILGIDHDENHVTALGAAGKNAIKGDATDAEFWRRVASVSSVRLLLLALPLHEANLEALQMLRTAGVSCAKAAIYFYPDQGEQLRELGVVPVNLYDGSGRTLAEVAMQRLAEADGPAGDRDDDG